MKETTSASGSTACAAAWAARSAALELTVAGRAHVAALIESVVLPQELNPMVILKDVVAFLREQGPEDDFNFQAAAVARLNGTLAIDV